MDRLATLQEAIERTSAMEEMYAEHSEPVVVMHMDAIDIMPRTYQDGWVTGTLQRAILLIAESHLGCELDGCPTCAEISNALGVSLFALRKMQENELEKRL